MEEHSSVKWSNAVRNVIEQKIESFEAAEKLAKKSSFTMQDWKLIEKKISRKLARHAEALLHESDS